MVGNKYTIDTASSTQSYGSHPVFLTTGQTDSFLAFKIGSGGTLTSYTAKSGTITFSNPLDERRSITDIFTDAPLYSDWREITLETTIEIDSTAESNFLSALTAGTHIFDLALTIDSGVEIETGYNYKIVASIARAHLNAPVEGRVTGMGVTEGTIKFTALNDETNPAIKFVVTNASSST